MQYAYGRSDHRLEDEAWGPDYHNSSLALGKRCAVLRHMYFLLPIMQSIPQRLVTLLAPIFEVAFDIQRVSVPT